MNYEKAKRMAKRRYRERLVTIGMAKKIADKVTPLLPQGWECKLDNIGFWLEFEKWGSPVDAMEFRVVCDLIERAIGQKLQRKAMGERSLRAEISLMPNPHRYLYIQVYLGNTKGCKIIKKKEMRITYVADPKCLGLTGEAR